MRCEWTTKKLSEIANFSTGKLNSNAAVDNGKYPFFTCAPEPLKIDTYNFDEKAIILAGNNAEGNFHISFYEGKFNAYQRTYIITSKRENVVDTKYLYYALKLCLAEFKVISQGTTTKFLTARILSNFEIILPAIYIQNKIAAILSALDEKIATNRAINDNLEQQAALLFDENYSNNDYDISPLEAIATIKYGKGLPTKYLTFQGYPVFGGNGVIGSYTYFMYKEPQVLVSCRGAASGNIMESYPNSFITNNSLVLEWNDYRYYEFYKQFLFANPLYSYATGSAQPQITIENIRNVPVPFPDYDEISDLCSILRSISVLHYENIVENNKLVTLRDTLLPRLMSGEIDVSAINL